MVAANPLGVTSNRTPPNSAAAADGNRAALMASAVLFRVRLAAAERQTVRRTMEENEAKRAVEMARRYCSGQISAREFFTAFVDSTDEMIGELVYLIDHERPMEGFFGAGKTEWAKHRAAIEKAIAELERHS